MFTNQHNDNVAVIYIIIDIVPLFHCIMAILQIAGWKYLQVSTKETSVMMKVISKCCFIYLNWFIALFEVFDKCMLGTLVVLNVTGGKIKTVRNTLCHLRCSPSKL